MIFIGRELLTSQRPPEESSSSNEHPAPIDEVEYMRWKAERGMKSRHMPVTFLHNPLFILRNAPKMFAHAYRGSSIRSLLGLEDQRKAFARYRAIRDAERSYI